MKTTLTTWLVLFGLLLQSAAWVLPAQQAAQARAAVPPPSADLAGLLRPPQLRV